MSVSVAVCVCACMRLELGGGGAATQGACSLSLPQKLAVAHPVTGPADFQLSIAHTIVIE